MLLVRDSAIAKGASLGLSLMLPAWGQMADGPGLPTLQYAASDVGKPLTKISNREGHGAVAIHRGYLVVIFSKDSGKGAGGISFLNISNPRSPVQVHLEDNAATQAIREPHGWGMRGDVACVQANEGMMFWNFRDVAKPVLMSYPKLPGIQVSDYDRGMWWTCWQGSYAYGGGSLNGIYIVQASNPASPSYVKTVPTTATGGFRVGPTFAIGNLLVVSGTDVAGISTFDIGDPQNPRLLHTLKTGVSYASLVNGNRLYAAGSTTSEDNGRLLVYDLSNPAQIRLLGRSANMGDKGGYVSVGDSYVFAGFSTKGFAKFDVSKSDFPAVAKGTAALPDGDEDFAVALGNLVFVGSDHIGGSSLMPHQTGRDTVPPAVNMVVPRDGAVNQPLTTRVGLTFTDMVENSTLSTATIQVRPVGGQALSGVYATQTGIVNFAPSAPLQANTTYEVTVVSGGVKDLSGNAVRVQFRSYFSTGGQIVVPVRPGEKKIVSRAASRRGFFVRPASAFPERDARGRAAETAQVPSP